MLMKRMAAWKGLPSFYVAQAGITGYLSACFHRLAIVMACFMIYVTFPFPRFLLEFLSVRFLIA